ncbi:hypothetical protein, partial [Mesorhizobium sp. 10.2.3]
SSPASARFSWPLSYTVEAFARGLAPACGSANYFRTIHSSKSGSTSSAPVRSRIKSAANDRQLSSGILSSVTDFMKALRRISQSKADTETPSLSMVQPPIQGLETEW